jgi:hypothetical protein
MTTQKECQRRFWIIKNDVHAIITYLLKRAGEDFGVDYWCKVRPPLKASDVPQRGNKDSQVQSKRHGDLELTVGFHFQGAL